MKNLPQYLLFIVIGFSLPAAVSNPDHTVMWLLFTCAILNYHITLLQD